MKFVDLLSGVVAVAALAGAVSQLAGQELQIRIIDFYGLNQISPLKVREALTFEEGDPIPSFGDTIAPMFTDSEDRLLKVPGVVRARINLVCCDNGGAIVYIGIEERGAPTMRLRAEPVGKARLTADIVEAGTEFSRAFESAVQRGDFAEDRSKGHALFADLSTRAIQERFLVYAKRDLAQLRLVLRNSSDAAHRALAAQVLGYAADKQTVVDDLVYGMTDPSEQVRNNAMRALLVFAEMVPSAGSPVPRIPHEPFIPFLYSSVWTDRNKASGALLALSARRDPQLLAKLRREALAPLVEMARWKSDGHATAAFFILARIAGYSDDAAKTAWDRGERDLVIGGALRGR